MGYRSSCSRLTNHSSDSGFTLVEVIMGIVVMAIAVTFLISVLAPQARNSVRPVMEVKAAELAQTLMNEILAKSYDENSDHDGSRWRCDETIVVTINPCTTVIGPETGETRQHFDDVDDYDTAGGQLSGNQLLNSSGTIIGTRYPGFAVQIEVSHDANGFNGSSAGAVNVAKRIDIIVTLPEGYSLTFSAWRGNY